MDNIKDVLAEIDKLAESILCMARTLRVMQVHASWDEPTVLDYLVALRTALVDADQTLAGTLDDLEAEMIP